MPTSAVDCVQPALQHTREQLFTRFRWGQWSRFALVGLLAAELHVGGCNFGNFGNRWPRVPHKNAGELLPSSRLPFDWPSHSPHIPEHIGPIIGLILLGIAVAIVVSFIFLYINSVFRFILFDSVLRRQCSIGEGWEKWRRAGGRFFLWQIVFQIAVWMFLLVLIGIPLAVALATGWAMDLKEHLGPLIGAAILLLGLFLLFALLTAAVQVLARDFLVPIMALEDLDFAAGWHRLLQMIGRETGRYVVYLLLKLVLSLAAAILFGIISIVPLLFVVVPGVVAVLAGRAAGIGWNVTTVSLAIILGTLLMLFLLYLIALVCVPATVFFPAYAIYFFASRYPQLDALLHPAPAPPAQPVPESPPPFEAPPLPPSAEPIG